MVGAELFIPLVILAITQMIKMAAPAIQGWVTIAIAFLVGIVLALIDGFIGVTDVTVAAGIVFALEAIGISVIAGKAGGGTAGDPNATIVAR